MRIKFTSNDQLVSMSDDQLNDYKNMLSHLINVRRRKNVHTMPYEYEMCWVQRETDIRNRRKKVHQKYIANRINTRKTYKK